ncbi:hypothetical protein QVZ41_14490 [Wenyingzhuangia sp. chi5]|uniref:Uncharacterized protein n=1 Tax=Wenyingzhuangia gilva TaxID=3057677 RepID=A0ABT8VVQ3_9FLAO|nr:hypothetical protein [Wenyingzhuangia sp. chi5]MDO3696058.1 hypothetical protein [Wenyingzhuangia sp. chi5]
MKSFFYCFDWDSFWMNVLVSLIFLIIGILISIKLIPYFTLKLIYKKRRKFILNKVSFLIQEFCDFLETNTFVKPELKKQNLSIFTSKKDLKTHHFVALIRYNVLEEITALKINIEILEYFSRLSPNEKFNKIENEKEKLIIFRNKLESLIDIHSLDIEENLLSEISDLCLKIRVFERKLKYNDTPDDLIKKGLMKRTSIFGVKELSEIYKLTLSIIKKLLELDFIDVEIENN